MPNKITAVIRRAVYVEPEHPDEDGEHHDEAVTTRHFTSRIAAVEWLTKTLTELAADPDEWYTGTATEYEFDPEFQDFLPVADLDQLNRDELDQPRWYTN